jgi:hypothetical protein
VEKFVVAQNGDSGNDDDCLWMTNDPFGSCGGRKVSKLEEAHGNTILTQTDFYFTQLN